MRGFLVGLVLLPLLAISLLSIKPGGLRHQLRNAGRRLRLVLILSGIYLLVSAVIRLAAPPGPAESFGLPALAVVLALVFVVLGQDAPASPPQSPTRR